MVQTLSQRIGNEVGRFPVHVGHPEGQQVTTAVALFQHFVFEITATSAVDDFVEIVNFHIVAKRSREGLSLQSLYEVGHQVVHVLQSHTQANGGVADIHLPALFIGERAKDGAGGMDGQRFIVK